MPQLEWLRVADALRDAGLPADEDAAQAAAVLLRARQVPVVRGKHRSGSNWRV
jgi:hypothetical protein